MTTSLRTSAILSPGAAVEEKAGTESVPAGASGQATSGTGMPARRVKGVTAERRSRVLLARRGRSWDAQEVAEHLMSCRGQMLGGLRHKTPWAGLDVDTLDSCFGHGAAVIARVAASGQRPEWRSAKDLEKAQIAAFRHQALDHWKRVNAQSRKGDRTAVAFDPERHASKDAPMDRLFAQPDLRSIQRDLLAELTDPELRVFWAAVLGEAASFKTAGDRLNLTKAQVMARTRAGRSAFAGYLDRRETGELCRERCEDIVAVRAGAANDLRAERARAHLESCYACSLVHQPRIGAFERGILGMTPTGLLLRLVTRAGEVASVPATRWTEVGAGARLVAGGVAALTVAGSGVGIEAALNDRPGARGPRPTEKRRSPAVPVEGFVTPARVLPRSVRPTPTPVSPTVASKRRSEPDRGATKQPSPRGTAAAPTTRRPAAIASGPAATEFSFERGGPAAPSARESAPARPTTPSPATEFSGP